ncbi:MULTISPECIES: S-adenosylmethionine decarboxylase family protein [unclassified Moritella]|uniref:S-adenosylmethionine decarboxylase family protein n=1 Tax=unclassified Moritella TaxID=2637987 RepID=UPI001BA593F9|nr:MULTISPECIES: S-adenosylmethionine decarboxylase [unclassified Moritella]QUM84198.1 S-adenosylmethionine decarboxylase [Moritella sp. 28]QUM88499.1 S-adenosylmethionine decarboxylase [Moritella sp. 36]
MEAKIYNQRWWLSSCDTEELKSMISAELHRAGFMVLNFVEHYFQPQGYTALWLLAESHAAVHTFPEEGKSYVELSSCAASLLDNFDRYLQESAAKQQWKVTTS